MECSLIVCAPVCVLLISFLLYIYNVLRKGPNPFDLDTRSPPKPLVLDETKRTAILRQRFTKKALNSSGPFDVIIIGSGIGGLATAVLLAKAGKRVCVLEAHDVAGGCCHTFIDKGTNGQEFEMDVGIHYIGQMTYPSLNRFLVDFISDGQLQWIPVDEDFDHVVIGAPEEKRDYPIHSHERLVEKLLPYFPDKEDQQQLPKVVKAMLDIKDKVFPLYFLTKTMSSWLIKFLRATGLFSLIFSRLIRYLLTTTSDFIKEYTKNPDLALCVSYNFGDIGAQPKTSSVVMQALLVGHYYKTADFPIGGSSEIAFNIIPVIERNGSKVFVDAMVKEVILENGAAVGVRMVRDDFEIRAPIVISDAGFINTFTKLLPRTIADCDATYKRFLDNHKFGPCSITCFIGFDKTGKELNLKAHHDWIFSSNDADADLDAWNNIGPDDIDSMDIPILFASFPSIKDPTWETRFPGRSTCQIVTFCPYEFFEKWENTRWKHRGKDYDELKQRIGDKMLKQLLRHYPHLEQHIVYFNVSSPITNNHFINSNRGEIYGVDHTTKMRFSVDGVEVLRAETPVKNLYMTGQDAFTCGFSGALYGGVMAASHVLNRSLYFDLISARKKAKKAGRVILTEDVLESKKDL